MHDQMDSSSAREMLTTGELFARMNNFCVVNVDWGGKVFPRDEFMCALRVDLSRIVGIIRAKF